MFMEIVNETVICYKITITKSNQLGPISDTFI